jgi:hypothetical protein
MRTNIFAVLFFCGLSTAIAGETNQAAITNQSQGVMTEKPPGTNVVSHKQMVLRTFDTQIADLQIEIQQVQDRRGPLELAQAQRRGLGLAPNPTDEAHLGELNGSLTYLTNQLQQWREERAIYVRTHGSTAGPRPPKAN